MPGEAAQAALREEKWREMESTWGTYSADEVAHLIEALPRAVLSVTRDGEARYPKFQFVTAADGTPMLAPAWVRYLELVADANWSPENCLMMAYSLSGYLEGRSPAEEIRRHPDDVTPALEHAADMSVPRGRRWSWE